MNDRIKILRKELSLTQDVFAEKLGVTRSAISQIENGDRNLTEQMLMAISNVYKVNYFWLRDGVGDIFEALPETIIDELVDQYGLDEMDKIIIQKFVELGEKERAVFKKYIKSMLEIK